jgi:enediyne biosynthesis protein E4
VGYAPADMPGRRRLGAVPLALALLVPGPALALEPDSLMRLGPGLHFTDVTAAAGIDVRGLGNASAWIDIDRDGDPDLMASDSDLPGADVWLYRNDGDGTFTDVTAAAGFAAVSLRSMAWGDVDNDGWPDLAGTTYASRSRTRLFRNRGDGTFEEIGAQAGLVAAQIPWRVAWADYDRDGRLDLYQANLGPDYLYHREPDGTFVEVASTAGVTDPAGSNEAAWGDLDNDGWPDLYVGNDGADRLYRNDRDGTFSDVTAQAGVSDAFDSVSACWADLDADGWQDLYVVDIGAPSNRLYRNLGDGTFDDVTAPAGVGDVGDGRTCSALDADNDGFLDLFASNHIHDNRLFRANGDGTFADIAPAAGLAQPFDTFNAAWGDVDGDGDLDAFVVGHSGNRLFRNDGPSGGFVHLTLVGRASNRSAIGARAVLLGGVSAPSRTVEGSGGAYGQDSVTLEFGVGARPGPFRLRLRWPSGAVRILSGVPSGSRLTVVEPPVAQST